MVEIIDKLLLSLIGKLGRNTSIPWKYTTFVMFHKDSWYRKHRAWCGPCNKWVYKKEMYFTEIDGKVVEIHQEAFCPRSSVTEHNLGKIATRV